MARSESLLPLKTLLFSFHASNTVILSFLPLYLQYKELNQTQIGWVLAIGPLASMFAQPFWGYMSDKFKTIKWVLFICVIGLLVGSTLFFQMNTLITIILMGAVFYFFTTPIGALGDSLAQRRADDLNIAFGSIRTWGSIGFAISSLVVGEILAQVGIQYMLFPYLFFGMMAMVATIKLKDAKVESEPVRLKDVEMIIKNKPFLIFLALVVFITTSHRMNDSYMGLYITELGGTEGLVGLAWFMGVIAEAAIFAFARFWFKKFHTLVFIIAAGILFSLRWFLYAAIDDPIYIIALQFLHGLTFGVFYTAAFEYVTRLIPKILQATGHLVFFAVFFGLSGIIGSLTGGVIMDNFGGESLYLLMGSLAAIGTILLTIYHILPYGKQNKARG
ncbi:MFS transporter [Oceanobacillus halophilus]|uniref:MFS transporter n=1 Tax=Oceanobacillus halophilus TaxID=930130 RepID=A0A495A5W5_9BACI|nr:MFS transporter [Oceanobacillus halophilus]RKQ34594.1 MFS transporter [Oceanobacillus halophilus]